MKRLFLVFLLLSFEISSLSAAAAVRPSGGEAALEEEVASLCDLLLEECLLERVLFLPCLHDSSARSALHRRALQQPGTVAYLIGKGALLEAQAEFNYTPLHAAVQQGCLVLVQALLAAGAQVDARDSLQNTPLHSACLQGHDEIVRELIAHGADVHVVNNCRMGALHRAAMYDKIGAINLLLAAGVIVDAQDHVGRTPLHWATDAGKLAAIKVLKDAGAQVSIRNRWGETTADRAQDAENQWRLIYEAVTQKGSQDR